MTYQHTYPWATATTYFHVNVFMPPPPTETLVTGTFSLRSCKIEQWNGRSGQKEVHHAGHIDTYKSKICMYSISIQFIIHNSLPETVVTMTTISFAHQTWIYMIRIYIYIYLQPPTAAGKHFGSVLEVFFFGFTSSAIDQPWTILKRFSSHLPK